MAFLLHGGSLYAVCIYLYLLVFFETLQSKNYHNMLFSSDFDWRAHVLFKRQANWNTSMAQKYFYYGHIGLSEFH